MFIMTVKTYISTMIDVTGFDLPAYIPDARNDTMCCHHSDLLHYQPSQCEILGDGK